MTVDRYTKAVLTVIAGSLLWICAMGIAPRVDAQQTAQPPPAANAPTVQPVVIVGTGSMDRAGKVTITYSQQGGARTEPTVPVWMPYTPVKPLPVSLSYTVASPLPTQLITAGAPLPVEISTVRKRGDWEPIRVAVEPAPTSLKPGGGGR
jgi:hypothetical protein